MRHLAATLLLLLPGTTSGFNLLLTRSAPSASAPIVLNSVSPHLSSTSDTHRATIAAGPETHTGITWGPTGPFEELSTNVPQVSRRNLFRGALWATGTYYGSRTIACASASFTVDQVEPDETDTYAEAQKGNGPLRVLWVGSGDMKGVFKNLFPAGNDVVAVDLRQPAASELRAATTYATEHGYKLRFERGDATKLKFADRTFDVVVCSLFLCQDFDPEVVVGEIRRVLKDGGRFGFYEHVEDIGNVIVNKVFGDRSVIRFQAYPEMTNIVAGVVRKV